MVHHNWAAVTTVPIALGRATAPSDNNSSAVFRIDRTCDVDYAHDSTRCVFVRGRSSAAASALASVRANVASTSRVEVGCSDRRLPETAKVEAASDGAHRWEPEVVSTYSIPTPHDSAVASCYRRQFVYVPISNLLFSSCRTARVQRPAELERASPARLHGGDRAS